MVFPIVEGKKWEPNRFFDEYQKIVVGDEQIKIYQGWRSKYMSLHQSLTIGSKQYDALHVNVVGADFVSNIERRQVDEYYVKDIGMIQRTMEVYDGDNTNPSEPWDKRAKKGFKHELRLIQFKK
jgi:hypothetical protein